jgi:uncharacterized protein (TIGR03435 family)
MQQSAGRKGSNVTLDAHGIALSDFAGMFGLDRPVIDKTGLSDRFDLHPEFTLDQSTPRFPLQGEPPARDDSVAHRSLPRCESSSD